MRRLIRYAMLVGMLLRGASAMLAGGSYSSVRFCSETECNCYFTIYLPEGYSDSVAYPVLYLLHGIHGNQTTWQAQGHVQQVADSLIAAGQMRPTVIVMPLCLLKDTAQALDISSYMHCMRVFLKSTRKGEFETLFPSIDEYVTEHYSVSTRREDRAVAGISAGGRQAASLSLDSSYATIGLFSPVVQNKQLPDGDNGSVYWIRCGHSDMFYKRTARALNHFDRRGVVYDYEPTEGQHNWKSWRRYIVDFLPFAFPARPRP